MDSFIGWTYEWREGSEQEIIPTRFPGSCNTNVNPTKMSWELLLVNPALLHVSNVLLSFHWFETYMLMDTTLAIKSP